jgi:hypothetical protein
MLVIGAISLYTIVALYEAKNECQKCDGCFQELERMRQERIENFNFTFPFNG